MKIILSVPGHLKTVPMSDYAYHTLTSMGHEVSLHNFGRDDAMEALLKRVSPRRFAAHKNEELMRLIHAFKPDVFLTIFGFGHEQAVIEQIRSLGILTICWWLNDPFQFERSLANASAYDFYFTNAKRSVDAYREAGLKHVYHLPVGCYPKIHMRLPHSVCKHDVCYAGDWNPIREHALLEIAKDVRLAIFGPWRKKLNAGSVLYPLVVRDGFFSPKEMVQFFNESKIVLNIHSWFGRWDYGTNPRLFEANGCGAFQLCDWKEEIPELYEADEEIALYKSIEELKEKLIWFLSRDDQRIAIANGGYARTHRQHTYQLRLTEMLSLCKLD